MAESKYHFEQLTPIDDMDLEVYEDAIDYIFDKPDIKNVAITGAYSAGKSSVLASYKKKHENLRFLHISLAHFRTPDKEEKTKEDKTEEDKTGEDKTEEDKTEVNESALEGKILNQLIHQIPSKKIPQTNFKVKKTISPKSVLIRTIVVVLLSISIIYFTCFNMWKDYVNSLSDNWLKSLLSFSTNQYALIVVGIIITCLFSLIVYELINIQKNRNIFRKLNLQGNEIEIFEESDDSYFDKYLNEVLYLFENAEVDVVVFEDMDRFDAGRIFERLREVNTLANIQLQKENKKKNKKVLRFFYLLRDDVFISKDRTKFFDYIVPVVPVVDSSNSYDQFISHLKKGGLFEKFNESFLQGLSLYIDDMRLLKNICNEFMIYYNRLNIIEPDYNKMLAIIAYKNLFPRDFADLQLNKGFVYTLFDSKDIFIAEEVKKLDERISEKNNEIEIAKNEHLKTIKELDVVFEDKKPKDYYGRKGNLTQEEQNEYSERKNAINNKLNNKISSIEDEIFILEQKLISIKSKQLKDIITRENINSIFSITSTNEIGKETNFNEIKSSEYFDLLKFLIRYGYIDETYADYMTYFYENSLSRIDKIFLRSITDKKAKEYTYKLKNPQLVASRLRLVDFDQEEILNFDLLTYLLHSLYNPEYIERFIDQLKNTKDFKFIGEYFDITPELSSYTKYLNIRWSEMFLTALNEHSLTEQQIRRYSICTIYYSDDEIIESVNKDNCLCEYISNSRDYLTIDNPNIDRLIHCFTLLGVCFSGFDYDELDKNLFRAVYEKSLYEINDENLQLIQREVLGAKNDEDILHKNYTLLCSHPNSAITQYINQNINAYFDVILKISDGMICDDENVAITILNNSDLTIEHKHSYISALRTTIISIKKITDDSLWSLLLDADILEYSEWNIMDCFNAVKLNKSVIAYINRCNIDLDFSKTAYDEDTKGKLFDCVIVCDSIENSKYEQILVSLDFYYDDFSITKIPNDKINILIRTNIIRMTAQNLEFIRENYPDQNYNFIFKNIEQYVDIMNDDLFSQDELLEILTWNISDELKIKLLEFSNDEISVVGKGYSTAVCLYILKNNLMESDFTVLFSSFENWVDSIQTKIFDYAVQYIESVIDNPKSVSEKLKNDLLRSDRIDRNLKIDLFISMMPDLDESLIKEILTLLDLTDYLKIFDTRSRPKFEINDENEKLLAALTENNLIASYEDSEKEGYYKIIRNKPTIKSLPQKL